MENNIFHWISVRVSVVVIIYMAVYSAAVDYILPDDQLNFFFSLFFLVIALNFSGSDQESVGRRQKIISLISDRNNIILNTILSVSYVFIMINSGNPVVRTVSIILAALVFYNFILWVFSRKIIFILFWVNLYLFLIMLVLAQLPGLTLDIVSRYNPFGGLIVYLFL